MGLSKKLVLFGTNRHAIAIDDYFMFFRRSTHEIVHIFYPIGTHRNRDWWEWGERQDRARESLVDPVPADFCPITVWEDVSRDVAPVLDRLDFDFLCFGNGNDPAQKWLIDRYGRERCLFSEYGWLPWSQHFYISRDGSGFDSEIARMGEEDIRQIGIARGEIERFKRSLDDGHQVDHETFIYMPLQKDVNDFKFAFNDFENNEGFLRFADQVAPPGLPILVKSHPLYKKKYDLSFSSRMYDVTEAGYNKAELYTKMVAMICLNSTSVLEALAFGRTVFTYGDDLFINKGLTFHKVSSGREFEDKLGRGIADGQPERFVSLLMSRQVNRRRCLDDDRDYIRRHYWNVCI